MSKRKLFKSGCFGNWIYETPTHKLKKLSKIKFKETKNKVDLRTFKIRQALIQGEIERREQNE